MRGEFVAGSGFDNLSFGLSHVIPRFQVGNHIFDQCSAFAPFNVTQGCTDRQSIVVPCLEFGMLAFPFIQQIIKFKLRATCLKPGCCAGLKTVKLIEFRCS